MHQPYPNIDGEHSGDCAQISGIQFYPLESVKSAVNLFQRASPRISRICADKWAIFALTGFQALTSAILFERFSALKFAPGSRICSVMQITRRWGKRS
jgi:hypothetical protein